MQQTKSKSLYLVLILVALVVMGQQTAADMYLCGTELNDALSTMCGRHGYNRMLKRSFDPTDYNDIEGGFGLARMEFDDRSLLHRMLGESAAQLMKTRRRRVGVSDECCLKPCSLGELLNYCAKPPGQYGN
ncbi:probable insulin-like peptide 3 [Drosophila miranda]|uniref:probable insulin-like peptide 3 n=1 Tax=Drosophila miranda TaxID=7229 RepID=UPI0007E8A41A|nr:probable insulin-like peptide 3 [Drosophila miranda]